jgi:hypothetical protein
MTEQCCERDHDHDGNCDRHPKQEDKYDATLISEVAELEAEVLRLRRDNKVLRENLKQTTLDWLRQSGRDHESLEQLRRELEIERKINEASVEADSYACRTAKGERRVEERVTGIYWS